MPSVQHAPDSDGSHVMATLEEALALAHQGYSVLPCEPGLRYPTVAWGAFQNEAADDEQLKRWFQRPDMNLAIATGPVSNVTVVDIDGEEGFQSLVAAGVFLPPTRIVKSPHGWHAYFKCVPGVKSNTGIYPKVDVKSIGGCVCVPPSVVADGVYEVLRDLPVADYPFDPETLTLDKPKRAQQERERNTWLAQVLSDGAPKGGRNATATRIAGYLRGKHIPQDVAEAFMLGFADRCQPPLTEMELSLVVKSVWRYYAENMSMDDHYKGEA